MWRTAIFSIVFLTLVQNQAWAKDGPVDISNDDSEVNILPLDEEIPQPQISEETSKEDQTPEENNNLVLKEKSAFDSVPLVELRHLPPENISFRERRPSHTWLFSFDTSDLLMDNFETVEDDQYLSYIDLYGDAAVSSPNFYIGYKYNTALGGIHFDVGYGSLSVSDKRSGQLRSIDISRPELRAGIILDNLFSEPYIAPYVNASVWKMSIKESNATTSVEYETDFGYTYSAGVLIQLNWLESFAAYKARINYGLENTYLDVFVTQQMATANENDPDVSTEPSVGFGLRMEF